MKKYLLTIVLVLLSCKVVQAQDPYRSAVKEYVESSTLLLEESLATYSDALKNVTKEVLVGYDESKANAIVERYCNEKLVDAMIDNMFLPAFKANVSLEEVHSQIALLQTPEGKRYQAHYALMMKKVNGESEEFKDLNLRLYEFYLKGTPLKDMKVNKNIPKAYVDKYFQVVDNSLQSTILLSFFKLMNKNNAEKVDRSKAVVDYLIHNIGIISLNLFYETMTIEDLEFIGKQGETGTPQRFGKAVKYIIDNSEQIGQDIISSYVNWLQRQEDVCDFLLKEFVNETKKTFQSSTDDNNNTRWNLDDEYLTLFIEGEEWSDLNQLKQRLEKEGESFKNTFKYEFPIFDNENLLRMIACSGHGYAIQFVSKKTGEKIQLNYDKNEVRHIYDHFQVFSQAQKGFRLYKNKNYNEAFPALLQAAEGGNRTAQYTLALLYFSGRGTTKNKEEYIKWLTIVAEQDENKALKADALNQKAYHYLDQKQYDKALSTIDKAIETLPSVANYYDSKGEILFIKGDKKGAKEMWKKVMTLDSEFLDTHNSTLYELLFKKKK